MDIFTPTDLLFTQAPNAVGAVTKIKFPGEASLAAIQVFGGTTDQKNDISVTSEGLIIITGYSYNQMTNQQIVQSLGEQFFLYSFGDRMGSVTINGYAFRGTCNSTNKNSNTYVASTKSTGLIQVLEFYGKNKINLINPTTGAFPIVRTIIDGQEIDGVLTSCNVNVSDASTYLGAFSMSLVTIPSS